MPLPLLAAMLMAAPDAPPARFPLGDRVLTGTGAGLCLIEGRWRDGTPLRYRAWTECAKLSISAVTPGDIAGKIALGRDKTTTPADIPPGAELISIANDASTVVVFRDAAGRQREILIGD